MGHSFISPFLDRTRLRTREKRRQWYLRCKEQVTILLALIVVSEVATPEVLVPGWPEKLDDGKGAVDKVKCNMVFFSSVSCYSLQMQTQITFKTFGKHPEK